MSPRRSARRIAAMDRSAIPSLRGLPWWTATLLAIAFSLTGVAIDSVGEAGELGMGFAVGFFLGCVAAILLVVRSSLLAVAVVPPLLMSALVPLVYVLDNTDAIGDVFDPTQFITVALPLVSRFPLMAITTAVVAVIALVRALLTESGARPQRSARGRSDRRHRLV